MRKFNWVGRGEATCTLSFCFERHLPPSLGGWVSYDRKQAGEVGCRFDKDCMDHEGKFFGARLSIFKIPWQSNINI